MNSIKHYHTAPLPFMGQKKRFLKKLKPIIDTHPESPVYVDLFGGSGLLSHTVKAHKPGARVIYNDFDNYRRRLSNIPDTNAVLAGLRKLAVGLEKGKQISGPIKSEMLALIKAEEIRTGYVDFITLSSSLLFSMQYALSFDELAKMTWYHSVRDSDYDATGYLAGVEIESADYKALFEKYRHLDNVIWLVDPPYLSTETKTYETYWKLRDYLDVLNVLDGTNYVYFTSNKSNIIELCQWVETRTFHANPFHGAATTTVDVQLNHSAKYTDIMLYKYDFVAAKK